MKGPDLRLCETGARAAARGSANRQRGSEAIASLTCGVVPGSAATHAEPGQVDAARVDAVVVHQPGEKVVELRRVPPAGGLGDDHDRVIVGEEPAASAGLAQAGVVGRDGGALLQQLAGAVGAHLVEELRALARPRLSGSVEEDDERVAAGGRRVPWWRVDEEAVAGVGGVVGHLAQHVVLSGRSRGGEDKNREQGAGHARQGYHCKPPEAQLAGTAAAGDETHPLAQRLAMLRECSSKTECEPGRREQLLREAGEGFAARTVDTVFDRLFFQWGSRSLSRSGPASGCCAAAR